MTLFSNKFSNKKLISKKTFAFSVMALGVAGFSTQAYAASSIDSININSPSANTTQIRLAFVGTPVIPVAYQQANSQQLVLDFNGTSAALPRESMVNTGAVKKITTLNSGATTRLMIDLEGATTYGSRIEGNTLVLDIAAVGKSSPIKVAPTGGSSEVVQVAVNPLLSPANAQSGRSMYDGVSSIVYNANPAGGGDISIALTNESIPVDVQRQGNKLIVRIAGASVPKHLRQRLNAGGLISHIDANNKGQNGIITIAMSEDYEYQAYQAGAQLHIGVRPADLLREPTLEEKVYTGEPLSMEFQDVPVRTVLEVLARFTNQNIVVNDAVGGNITLRLINVPWDQALDIILRSKNLDKRSNGNVIWVAQADELAKREAEDLRAQNEIKDLAPLRTEYISLNYMKVDAILSLIEKAKNNSNTKNTNDGGTSGLLSSRGSVMADTRTNTLIIKDTAKSIENIRAMLEKIDIPVSQVMIEARIVSASDSFAKDMGVKWGLLGHSDNNPNGNPKLNIGGSNDTLWDLRKSGSDGSITVQRPNNLNVDLGANNVAGRIAFGILGIPNTLLDLELSAMQADNRGEVISSPKVLTADKQKARISSGQQIAFQEASASGATSTSFKEAALVLEVTPNITPDGKIGLELSIKNGSPVRGGAAIQEDSIETNVMLEDGQTVVLGGVFRNTIGNQVDKVPFLGDLPYIGDLFKRQSRQNSKEELLIFVTPKLVSDNIGRIN